VQRTDTMSLLQYLSLWWFGLVFHDCNGTGLVLDFLGQSPMPMLLRIVRSDKLSSQWDSISYFSRLNVIRFGPCLLQQKLNKAWSTKCGFQVVATDEGCHRLPHIYSVNITFWGDHQPFFVQHFSWCHQEDREEKPGDISYLYCTGQISFSLLAKNVQFYPSIAGCISTVSNICMNYEWTIPS
jgi:hypothetical protein